MATETPTTLRNPIPFKVTEKERDDLDALAKELGLNRSETIRKAIRTLAAVQEWVRVSAYAAQVYRWANREGRKIGPNAHAVLVELCTYTNLKTAICWPNRKTIAANIYATENPTKSQLNMVSTAIRELTDAGLISVFQEYLGDGRYSSNTYLLALPVPTQAGHGSPVDLGTEQPNRPGHGSPVGLGTKSPVNLSKEKVSTEGTSGGIQGINDLVDLYGKRAVSDAVEMIGNSNPKYVARYLAGSVGV